MEDQKFFTIIVLIRPTMSFKMINPSSTLMKISIYMIYVTELKLESNFKDKNKYKQKLWTILLKV